MNKDFYTPENIEAFLENKLTPNEKAFFESEIAKDPLLQNEVSLQKDIVDSLKDYRKLELKSRLNKIEVPATNYVGLKIAASVLLAGLLGFGIYSYVNKPEIIISEASKTEVSKDINSTQQQPENSIGAIAKPDKTEEPVSKETESATSSTAKSQALPDNSASDEMAHINTPQVLENLDNDNFQNQERDVMPDGQIAQSTETKLGFDVNRDNSTENKFHYKFYNNKLFLYGDFDSNQTYFHELNTNKGKQVYLYFEKNYFHLNSNQLEVAPLQKITDKKLIEELNQRQKTLMKNYK